MLDDMDVHEVKRLQLSEEENARHKMSAVHIHPGIIRLQLNLHRTDGPENMKKNPPMFAEGGVWLLEPVNRTTALRQTQLTFA